MLACCTSGCAPTVCWTRGFMGFLPVIRPPDCSGSASSGGFSSHLRFTPFAMGAPLRGRGSFVLDPNEGVVCFSFPFGLLLHVVPALRDEVTIWVRCWLGAPADSRGCCALFSLWLGFEPLSEASLRALSGRCFLVVLSEAESLRLSLALSKILPCPMLWLLVRLHGPCSGSWVVLGALP